MFHIVVNARQDGNDRSPLRTRAQRAIQSIKRVISWSVPIDTGSAGASKHYDNDAARLFQIGGDGKIAGCHGDHLRRVSEVAPEHRRGERIERDRRIGRRRRRDGLILHVLPPTGGMSDRRCRSMFRCRHIGGNNELPHHAGSCLVTRLTALTPASVMMSPATKVPVMALVVSVGPVWLAPLTVPAVNVPAVCLITVWSMYQVRPKARYITPS